MGTSIMIARVLLFLTFTSLYVYVFRAVGYLRFRKEDPAEYTLEWLKLNKLSWCILFIAEIIQILIIFSHL